MQEAKSQLKQWWNEFLGEEKTIFNEPQYNYKQNFSTKTRNQEEKIAFCRSTYLVVEGQDENWNRYKLSPLSWPYNVSKGIGKTIAFRQDDNTVEQASHKRVTYPPKPRMAEGIQNLTGASNAKKLTFDMYRTSELPNAPDMVTADTLSLGNGTAHLTSNEQRQ